MKAATISSGFLQVLAAEGTPNFRSGRSGHSSGLASVPGSGGRGGSAADLSTLGRFQSCPSWDLSLPHAGGPSLPWEGLPLWDCTTATPGCWPCLLTAAFESPQPHANLFKERCHVFSFPYVFSWHPLYKSAFLAFFYYQLCGLGHVT